MGAVHTYFIEIMNPITYTKLQNIIREQENSFPRHFDLLPHTNLDDSGIFSKNGYLLQALGFI